MRLPIALVTPCPFLQILNKSLLPTELGLDYLAWFSKLSKAWPQPVFPASFAITPFYMPFTPGHLNYFLSWEVASLPCSCGPAAYIALDFIFSFLLSPSFQAQLIYHFLHKAFLDLPSQNFSLMWSIIGLHL